jgi:hypothetical protein
MHPYLMEKLAREHQRELLRCARPNSPSRLPGRTAARRSARQRAGWALIELGLRLAAPAGEA